MTRTIPPMSVPIRAQEHQGRRAGVVTRVAASFIDLLVVIAIVAGIYAGIAALSFLLDPTSFHWPERLGQSVPVSGFAILTPYLALCWVTTGRTYGDALLGLRVIDSKHRKLGLTRAFVRALLCAIFPIGLLWVTVSRTNRSIHDLITRTSVIYDWTPQIDVDRPVI